MRNKCITVLALLLCGVLLFGFSGCGKEDNPTTGSTTDKTDYNAPKEIKSKDIIDFYATFCLAGEWTKGEESLQYEFEVKKDSKGKYTASESTVGIVAPADETLLKSLQDIIDRFNLVKDNGVYKVTAGLAPECRECSLDVYYKSGESLKFTKNNDPYAQWEQEMYMTFADWFAEKGDESLMPPETTS